MKKKFNPSAALGYKRIKPLYDKAVSDLVIAQQDIEKLQSRNEREFFNSCNLSAKVDRQKAKLKAAGHMIGHLIRERDAAISNEKCITEQLIKDQSALVDARRSMHESGEAYIKGIRERGKQINDALRVIESLRGTQSTLDKQLDTLRHIAATQKCARYKAERERDSALADVRQLKAGKRNVVIFAGAVVGGAVAALVKLIEMGAF